jgi:hypothetical protein
MNASNRKEYRDEVHPAFQVSSEEFPFPRPVRTQTSVLGANDKAGKGPG